MIGAFSTGFASAFALILAIGAQNAFVLRQGITKTHVFWICLTCAVSDAILIVAGIIGFGALVTAFPVFPDIMRIAGGAFLVFYGALRFWTAYLGNQNIKLSGNAASLKATLGICLALTWLNPHVYLDTLGLIGAISTQFTELNEKVIFGVGAVGASFVFFFSLGYGARLLVPIMSTSRAWRVLDILIGVVMWLLAFGLLKSVGS